MERYIGLDAHASSCTLAVVGPSGRRLGSHVVETNARALIEVLRAIPRNRHVCLEEGTLSGWLYEVLEPHVEELVVTGVRKSRGPKSDKVDAFVLAEGLRIGSLETRVYKERGKFRRLGHVARAYGFVVQDVVRVKNRLKSVLRSRGVGYGAGSSVYAKRDRERWLGELPDTTRPLAEVLYEELDGLVALKAKAEKALLAEARRHREWRLLKTCPGMGPIRTAELLPVVVTPYRFGSRSQFWAYSGLGIVMRSSADWVRTPTGQWVKSAVQQTRGLNRNFNHTLKRVFKGAATTVIGRGEEVRRLKAEGYLPVLKGTRFCLLKRPENLTESQEIKLAELLQYNLRAVRAYLLKEDFQFFWDYVSPAWAGKFLDRWCTRTMRSRLDPMKRVARMLRRHRELLLNWFRARGTVSAAAVEGLNNKLKVTTKKAYGFRTFRALEIALLHALGDLPEPKVTHRF